jgi:hypothetical protein
MAEISRPEAGRQAPLRRDLASCLLFMEWTRGVTAMQLPFTKDQFFDLFAAYNSALWPALLALWTASVVVSLLLISPRRPTDRWVSALLAGHWAWSALAYHAAFFTRINPAAWIFAMFFLVQAALFVWVGIVQRRLSFAPTHNAWALMALLLIAYSLVYPAINAVQHLTVSRIPTFGVPCPTAIFTAGFLMLAAPRSRLLAIIPVLWSLVGGSAAVLLDVRADYALPIAGIALAVFSIQKSGGQPLARILGSGSAPRPASA